VAPTHDQALAELDAALAERGMDPNAMGADDAAAIRGLIPHGDPDEIGELFATYLVDGIDGLTVSAIANGHLEGRVALLGETLAPLVS
jgi:alkanesulfonate monooxygenase SsuD/methylene tetrahydromethanopterin reductase-like flavin-dependent oxidoreductase (luciferase family)